jgi:hypothetical protein
MSGDALPEPIQGLLAALSGGQDWLLETVGPGSFPGAPVVSAGCQHGLSWWTHGALDAPAVVMTTENVLLDPVWAQEPLGWSETFSKLERRLNGRMVRFPTSHITSLFPRLLPLQALRHELPDGAWSTEASKSEGSITFRSGSSLWLLRGSDPMELDVVDWWVPTARLRFGAANPSFPTTVIDEAVDADDVNPEWRRVRANTAASGRLLHRSESSDGALRWVLRDAYISEALGLPHAAAAERAVRSSLAEQRPDLAEQLEFDSEADEFFCYASSEAPLLQLSAMLDALIAERASR